MWLIAGTFGLALIYAGLVLSNGVDEYALVALGAAFPLVAFTGQIQRCRSYVTDVTITDAEVRLTSKNGAERSARWDRRPIFVRLSHAIEHPPGTPVRVPGRILEWSEIHTSVSDQIVSAILDRARRLGFQVSRETEKWPSLFGFGSIIEVLEIRESATKDSATNG